MASRKLALSVPEVAELLGISRAFAYELVARRELWGCPGLTDGLIMPLARRGVEGAFHIRPA